MSPAYQSFGPRDAVPPPFYSQGGSFLILIVEGQQAQMQALVDTALNVPAEGAVTYTVPGKWVAIQVGSYVSLGSRAQGFVSEGLAAETSIAFWVPLVAKAEGGAVYVALTAPFVYVDQPMSLTSGREVFGYPKTLGRFKPPIWNGTELHLEAFGGRYAQGSHASWGPLLDISSLASPSLAAGLPFAPAPADETPTSVAEHIFREVNMLPDTTVPLSGGLWETVMRFLAMFEGTMRQAFLKQFRDLDGSPEACYRKVIEANGKVLNPQVALSTDTWHLTFHTQDNHPITAELGLAPTIQTKLAVTMTMDIELLDGQVVGPPAAPPPAAQAAPRPAPRSSPPNPP